MDSQGLSRGLLTGSNRHLTRSKDFHSYARILIKARFKGLDSVFSIMNCYGPYSNKNIFWDCVVAGGIFNYPNLILDGDLNFTLSDLEVWGEKTRLDQRAHYFSHLLDSMNMVDLAPITPGPAWRNGRMGSEGVSKRLDRFLASIHLIPMLGNYNSWTRPSDISDHYS